MAEQDKKPTGNTKDKSNSFFKRVSKFFRDCKGEIKKIVWPNTKTVFKSTGVVLITVIASSIVIAGIDLLFMNLFSLVMNISQ